MLQVRVSGPSLYQCGRYRLNNSQHIEKPDDDAEDDDTTEEDDNDAGYGFWRGMMGFGEE